MGWKLRSVLIIAWFITTATAWSQEIDKTEEITVVAPYQPSLEEAYKISLNPQLPEDAVVKPSFTYRLTDKVHQTSLEAEPIVPARITGESVKKLYRNYVRLGFGNYTTPYFEFFAGKLRSKESYLGVRLKHLSSSGKIKDYAHPGYSNNLAELNFKRFFPQHTLSADAGFHRDVVHFYGFQPAGHPGFEYSKKDIRQIYNKIKGDVAFQSNYMKAGKLNHKLKGSYYYLSDNYSATEHYTGFTASVDKDTEIFGFTDRENLSVRANLDYYFQSDSLTGSVNDGIISIDPSYRIQFSEYSFSIGVNTSIETGVNSYMYFYPHLKAEVSVIENRLITYAGIRGNMKKNSFDRIRLENPYVSPVFDREFTYNKIEQFGGIKGNIADALQFNLSFSNSTIDNMPLFVNDTVPVAGDSLHSQFGVIYDDSKYTRLNVHLGYNHDDRITLELNGSYNSYFMDNEDEAWHKPALEANLIATYNLRNKILVRGELFAAGKRFAKSIDNGETVAVELDGYADVNLGIEYRYTPLLSAFVNFNNILNQQYFHWNRYPSYRFNFLAGVSYSF